MIISVVVLSIMYSTIDYQKPNLENTDCIKDDIINEIFIPINY